jgi:regulator of RNase E activity RraA
MPSIAPEVLDKLRTFDTTTICNVIELFEVRPRNEGYMDSRIKACYPEMPPIVGFAATATFRGSSQDGESSSSALPQIETFARLSGPPIVVIQDLDEPSVGASFGELMCTTYQAFGAVGLITSGSGRDLNRLRALNFPIFTNGASPSRGHSQIVAVGTPVQVGGVTVQPDALIHADSNGVTTIPVEIAAELADLGYEYTSAEAVVLDVLRSDTLSAKSYAEARREADDRLERLRRQVSRVGRS